MKETSISLENAGSSLTEWARRARREHTTFVVLDATKPIARLIPAESPRCTGAELARALAGAELSTEEARAWAKDLRESRAELSPPEDRWR
jgi:antitoxin (DNA-binding transcriptional repressor) of toxin-antitoxin stability system